MRWARRFRNLLQFQLEQFILRGVLARLLVIALAMLLLSLVSGFIVYGSVRGYDDLGAAIWWSFLHLTDTGYLGDDQGTWLRLVSTVITVLGVVLFLGGLVATMTQWLNNTIEKLEQGYTPIAQNNHVLILGWTNRTAMMVEQLVRSQGRVARFLRRHGTRRLKIVILAERLSPALVQELKDRLGPLYRGRQITLRSGSPLRAEHLRRVDYRHAAAIVLPAREFGAAGPPDEATIKTLMSAAHSDNRVMPDALPLVVAEVFDAEQLATARRAYPGPAELIGTPLFISQIMAQNVRHRGLFQVYDELLGGYGNRMFIRELPDCAGQRLADLAPRFEHCVLLGVARESTARLEPLYSQPSYVLQADDRLAFVARSFDDCVPAAGVDGERGVEPNGDFERQLSGAHRRVLVLGWSRKVPALIAEFDAYTREPVTVDVFSLVDAPEREVLIKRKGVVPTHARLRHLEGDFTSRADLQTLDVAGYDNIILVASDGLGSAEAADARTLVGYLVLTQVLGVTPDPPGILVEAMTADNAPVFDAPNVNLLVSPDMQSNILTQVALRRELNWIMEELFDADGAEVVFRDVRTLDLPVPRDAAHRGYSFFELQQRLAARGDILLGFMRKSGAGRGPRITLNPADKSKPLPLRENDALIVFDIA